MNNYKCVLLLALFAVGTIVFNFVYTYSYQSAPGLLTALSVQDQYGLIPQHRDSQWFNVSEYLHFTDEGLSDRSECGRLWLYEQMKLVLSITHVSHRAVHISNISHRSRCNASRISIFVTVFGVELLGGLATPHPTDCAWTFPFSIQQSSSAGQYTVDARLLYVDGALDMNHSLCNAQYDRILYNADTTHFGADGRYLDDTHIVQRIDKSKFYAHEEQCCEWCTRHPQCEYYLSESNFKFLAAYENRCILFGASAIEHMQLIDTNQLNNISRAQINHTFAERSWLFGHNRKEKTSYYLGSLMATTPTQQVQCQKTDLDLIYNSSQIIHVSAPETPTTDDARNTELPFCSWSNMKSDGFDGQWIVRQPLAQNMAKIESYNSWTAVPCAPNEYNCDIPVQFHPVDCRWRYNNTLRLLRDLHDLYDFNMFYIDGDSIIGAVKTYLAAMFGLEYKHHCGETHIANHSVVHLCSFESSLGMQHRSNLRVKSGRNHIVLHNGKIVHRIWHKTLQEVEQELDSEGERFDALLSSIYGNLTSNWPLRIFMESPTTLSEREYHCTGPRSIRANEIIHKIMGQKYGWHIFPFLNITRAVQYRYSDGQDGLHPWSFVLADSIRMLLELALNTIAFSNG